jgi:hypothetical protein
MRPHECGRGEIASSQVARVSAGWLDPTTDSGNDVDNAMKSWSDQAAKLLQELGVRGQ